MINTMKHLDGIMLHVSAKPGAALGNCIQDALVLATTEWRNIEFVHSEKRYQILVNDLAAQAKAVDEELVKTP